MEAFKSPSGVDGSGSVEVETAPKKKRGRSVLLGATATALVAGAAQYGHAYWTVGGFHVETDDAYDNAGDQFWIPNIVHALGQALVLTPITAIATAAITSSDDAAASGLSNMLISAVRSARLR